MFSSTKMARCGNCGDELRPDDLTTVCRICGIEFHCNSVCAGVTEALEDKYGCSNCFEIRGNEPRRRIRAATQGGAADGEVDISDVQDETMIRRPPAEPTTEAHSSTSAVGLLSTSLMPPAPDMQRAKTRSHASGSVASSRSQRETLLMEMLQRQTELMAEQTKVMQTLATNRSSRGSSSRSSTRVKQWVQSVDVHTHTAPRVDLDEIVEAPLPSSVPHPSSAPHADAAMLSCTTGERQATQFAHQDSRVNTMTRLRGRVVNRVATRMRTMRPS